MSASGSARWERQLVRFRGRAAFRECRSSLRGIEALRLRCLRLVLQTPGGGTRPNERDRCPARARGRGKHANRDDWFTSALQARPAAALKIRPPVFSQAGGLTDAQTVQHHGSRRWEKYAGRKTAPTGLEGPSRGLRRNRPPAPHRRVRRRGRRARRRGRDARVDGGLRREPGRHQVRRRPAGLRRPDHQAARSSAWSPQDGKFMGSTVSPDGRFLAATSTDRSVVAADLRPADATS